ncbi:hypothetical protein ASE86_15095 [Sphingomonas sp. Leaf33]|uniref:hypothetical protein n=1 Tax=Sphingomonas sp. Leaf33 TaxID=1736215 RepID=UPI0006FF8F09|nr:hypothetical protein [Sphingomonas sp. Leaf33]KQN20582.1 hypothetical protein ASE86_15095 [Sphingomonas sp. Leaf33]
MAIAMQGAAPAIDAARNVRPPQVVAQAFLPTPAAAPQTTSVPRAVPVLARPLNLSRPERSHAAGWPQLPSQRQPEPSRETTAPSRPEPAPIGGDPLAVARLPDVDPQENRRISVSGWLIARPGRGTGSGPFAPQLGGSQAGIRIDYALSKAVAATVRLTAPTRGIGREMALGVAWRPAGVPLRVVVEQRIALDAGRGGPSIGVSGGVSAVPLPANFRLEGYAQAGVIVRNGVERFADGSARATRPLSEGRAVDLDIGLGAWGGAQRGASRLDIGPSLGARVAVAGQRLRVALDWRQRIAGDARPGSGPALSMGLDF